MKQCREHNCPLQDICRGAVDNETWWNISDDCEIFAFVKKKDDTIFDLENRLKECENGYEGTLFLDRCKLHDAEEKVKELTQSNEMLSESYNHLEKTKDDLVAERSRLIMQNERLITECGNQSILWKKHFESIYETAKKQLREETIKKFQSKLNEERGYDDDWNYNSWWGETINQVAKEMLEGE